MAYFVDRVVICEAFREPGKHYQLLSGGRSQLVNGRRPSMRFMVSASATRGGIGTIVGAKATFFEDLSSSTEQNDFVTQLRDEIRDWRSHGYPRTALVTRRLREWSFERDQARKAMGKRFFFCQQEALQAVPYLQQLNNPPPPPGRAL